MSEWWTYRPSDFLLFSPRTYHRLFELMNAELWPAPLVALGLGVALAFFALRGGPAAARAVLVALAGCWLWVAWAFHLQRYASVNWAAPWFAAAFAVEAALLLALAAVGAWAGRPPDGAPRVALALLALALVGLPLIGRALGRPWSQAELFAMAPDPTALATLAFLLLLPRRPAAPRRAIAGWLSLAAWPIPLGWCLLTGLTLWTMNAAGAWVVPVAAGVAAIAAGAGLRRRGDLA